MAPSPVGWPPTSPQLLPTLAVLLRPKMAFEGVISSLGASRGLDGSIDRVAEPPLALWEKLAFVGAKCDTENIEILSVFEDNGGNHHGMMKRERFCTALKDSFTRYHFDEALLREITDHYGVGYKNPRVRARAMLPPCTSPPQSILRQRPLWARNGLAQRADLSPTPSLSSSAHRPIPIPHHRGCARTSRGKTFARTCSRRISASPRTSSSKRWRRRHVARARSPASRP